MINLTHDRFPFLIGRKYARLPAAISPVALALGAGLAGIEAVLIGTAAFLGPTRASAGDPALLRLALALALGASFVLLLHAMRGYRFGRLRRPETILPQLLALGLITGTAGIGVAHALRPEAGVTSASMVGLMLTLAILAFLRMALAGALRRVENRGGLRRRIAVIDLAGGGAAIDRDGLRRRLETTRHCRCALDVLTAGGRAAETPAASAEAARWADEIVVVAVPGTTPSERLAELLAALEVVPVAVSLAVPVAGSSSPGFAFSRIHEVPLTPLQRVSKRLFDLLVAGLALALVLPLMAVIALLIKADSPGPVFFRQTRRGFNNRPFDALKFRSLRHDAADPRADRLVTRGDPRVTRIGGFLRRSSLDELPQLVNVLKGDMALVGPRPHPLNAKAGGRAYEDVVARFQRRYRVRRGITSWAQVNGLRGNTETEDDLRRRVALDLEYIRHWSLWLDLWILAKTPIATFKGENAC